jgi:hypothetical protein
MMPNSPLNESPDPQALFQTSLLHLMAATAVEEPRHNIDAAASEWRRGADEVKELAVRARRQP